MFSHIMVGVSDFKRAMAFYQPVLDALGVQFRFLEEDRPWAGWQSSPEARPLFLIGRPHHTTRATARWSPSWPRHASKCKTCTPWRWPTAAPAKARPACGPSTTRITTARISEIRMGTSFVWLVMGWGRWGVLGLVHGMAAKQREQSSAKVSWQSPVGH